VGNLITVLLQISSRLWHWKNFENRPVFDKVMPKILLVRFFSGHGVYQSVHWLPVRARTDFKLSTLAFQSQATGQPDYLAVEIHPHEPQRCLCSLSQELLTVPNCKTMLGSCRFLVAAPRIWNNLPLDLKTDSNSLCDFKSSLKMYLYRRDYI